MTDSLLHLLFTLQPMTATPAPPPHTCPPAVELLLSGSPLTSMFPDPVDPPLPSWQTQPVIPSLKHLPLVSFSVSLSGFTLSMFQPEFKHLGYPWLVSRPSCFLFDALSPVGWLIHSRIYGDVCEDASQTYTAGPDPSSEMHKYLSVVHVANPLKCLTVSTETCFHHHQLPLIPLLQKRES